MICPRCQGEYREGFTRCHDCGIELVHLEDLDNCQSVGFDKVIIKGKPLVCLVCGGDEFSTNIPLNPRGLTFLKLDSLSQHVMNYTCIDCGYIFWFKDTAQHDVDLDEASEPMDDECPNCFSQISLNDTQCSNCGHRLGKE